VTGYVHDCVSSAATCGNCHRRWCHVCDPGPAALCPFCHGRGYSTHEIRVGSWPDEQPRLHAWSAKWHFWDFNPEHAMDAFSRAADHLEGEGIRHTLVLYDSFGEVILTFGESHDG